MGDPDVSVVICTLDRADLLRDAVASVLAQDTRGRFRFEVLVVDDGSTDNTAAVVEALRDENPDQLVYLPPDASRKGVSAARNRGAMAARGRWIVYFDDDQRALPGWLIGLLDVAAEHQALCVGGAIRVEALAGAPALGPVCRGLLGEHVLPGPPTKFTGRELPSTGNLLIERGLLLSAGGFDESLRCGEDTDLLLRLRARGAAIWGAPGAVIEHRVGRRRYYPRYLNMMSRRWGAQFARNDHVYRGRAVLLCNLGLRMAQAIACHAPMAAAASILGRPGTRQDRIALLWRVFGFVEQGLPLLFRKRVHTVESRKGFLVRGKDNGSSG